MFIAGFVKNSFVDYPTKIACTIFTAGCNMKCWYCHNSHILKPDIKKISQSEIISFLKERKSFLDAVVISGGEPTLQEDLEEFLTIIKEMGYLVKLDTNGTNSKVLSALISRKLVDYVAMDIKAPLTKYSLVTKTFIDIKEIERSIKLLMSSEIDYEFRTTFSPDLTIEDIEEICKTIKGSKRYFIQKYNNVEFNKINMTPRPKADFEKAKIVAENYVENVKVRGLD